MLMHIEKYNRTAVGHMLEHYERNPKIYKTQKHINPELTKLNYTLSNDKITGMAKYKKILETPGLKVMNRADVNTIIDIILTLPQAKYFPQERYKEFFQVGYNFLMDKLGYIDKHHNNQSNPIDRLVGAYIHCDEAQYHMHFCIASIVDTNKGLRMNASKIVTRQMLCTLHKEASDYFYDHFGFDVGILNGATKEGNLTVPQLREQTKRYNELIKANKELQSENEQLKLELEQNMHNLKVWQQAEDITPVFEQIK